MAYCVLATVGPLDRSRGTSPVVTGQSSEQAMNVLV